MAVVLPEGVEADAAEVVEAEEVLEVGDDDVEVVAEAEPVSQEGDEIVIAVGGEDDEVVHTVSSAPGPRRVLVVDDEPEIRMLVERTLAARGFSVDVATDGEQAYAKISAAPPDLVLLDAMLPKMHGFEVCRKVRSDPRTRAVPIIIMTAVYRGWRFAQDARETYGAEDYIEKPFHLDDLLRRVEAVLESTSSRAQKGASAEPQLKKGKELLLAGQIDAAIAAFEEAIRSDPFSADAHHQLAKALKAKGDHFRAMTAFERAVELRQGFFQALRSLAALYTEKGFRRKAAETLERALAAAPDSATRDAIKADLLKIL
jgi:DNA-binding response OmpR family regulator